MDSISNYTFEELKIDELNMIDGGVDWNSIGMGTAMTAGGLIGAKVGAGGGLVGVTAGTVIGGIAGGIIYSFWD